MNTTPSDSVWDRNRTLLKGLLIGFLILIMLIPQVFISNLVNEREQRRQQVVEEVSSKWATAQNITGPLLIVPYVKANEKTHAPERRNAYFLPDQLKINGNLQPEVRKRSLYSVTLYHSDLELTGRFDALPLQKLQIDPSEVLWNEVKLAVGIDDARGLEEEVMLHWNNAATAMEAGVPENGVVNDGLSTVVNAQAGGAFSLHIKLKGSEYLHFTPVGKTTEVTLQSPWKDPKFEGQYLPSQQADVTDKGFVAKWKIMQVSRSYPQYWTRSDMQVRSSAFGVQLIQPTDNYAKTDRSVKYALLFIGLTFVVFFFIELLQKKQIHPLQYLMVGMALCIFYTLLLSISEYTGFDPAYLVAATATVSLIGIYVWSIFRNGKTAAGFTAALAGLYGYIYILIQLQDYALLFGSIGLFIILAVIMLYSRKIDWYNTGRHTTPQIPHPSPSTDML
jgi:inner membrane protein